MKVILLSPANSIHTERWANGLVDRGVDVYLISLHKFTGKYRKEVKCFSLPFCAPIGYFLSFFALKALIKKIMPDILNVHYASGYGFLARLVHFYPSLLSVWGSDIYEFPEKTFIHRAFLRKNIQRATAIASTSNCMAKQLSTIYKHHNVFITPFGIDENIFFPKKTDGSRTKLIIGTVKTLQKKYGIDTLISAFSLLHRDPDIGCPIELHIYGDGPDSDALKDLVKRLNICDSVIFYGRIQHSQVPEKLNTFDVYVALSRKESFGVAILEANACGKPVVVSDAEGPSEVVVDGKNGIIVHVNDEFGASQAIKKLLLDKELCLRMGQSGREHVLNKYTWSASLDAMIDAYKHVLLLASG